MKVLEYLLKRLGYVKERDKTPSEIEVSIHDYLKADNLERKVKTLEDKLECSNAIIKNYKDYVEQVKAYITNSKCAKVDCVGEPSLRYLVESLVEALEAPAVNSTEKLSKRYLVIKHEYINRYLNSEERVEFGKLIAKIDEGILVKNRKLTNYVVIGEDWPEYKETVSRLLARISKEKMSKC